MKLQLQKNLILISVLTSLFTSSVFAQEEFEVSPCSSTIDGNTNEKLCGYGDTRQEAAEDYCGLRFGSTSETLLENAAHGTARCNGFSTDADGRLLIQMKTRPQDMIMMRWIA